MYCRYIDQIPQEVRRGRSFRSAWAQSCASGRDPVTKIPQYGSKNPGSDPVAEAPACSPRHGERTNLPDPCDDTQRDRRRPDIRPRGRGLPQRKSSPPAQLDAATGGTDIFDHIREIPAVADGIRCQCSCADLEDFYSLLTCYSNYLAYGVIAAVLLVATKAQLGFVKASSLGLDPEASRGPV